MTVTALIRATATVIMIGHWIIIKITRVATATAIAIAILG